MWAQFLWFWLLLIQFALKLRFNANFQCLFVYQLANRIICLLVSRKMVYSFESPSTRNVLFLSKWLVFAFRLKLSISILTLLQWTRIKSYRFCWINTNCHDKCSNDIRCRRFLLKFPMKIRSFPPSQTVSNFFIEQ